MDGSTKIEPLRHYCDHVEHFIAQCKRELEQYPRQPIPRPEPHPVVMDPNTPALLRKQAA